MDQVTLEKVKHAKSILEKILPPTPLVRNEWLSTHYNCEVYLKLETAQPVGSFKIRGATYRISQLSEADRKKGIIAASAGNHAQGVAWGSRYYHTQALIVMPVTSPLMKIMNTQALGAKVHLEGDNYEQSYQAALRIAQETGRVYVHAFHDPWVIAGQGTSALEVLDQCPGVDYVVSSIGGGGWIAGLGVVFKALKPNVKVIGCQAENADSMAKSFISKKVIQSQYKGTFADGIAVQKANPEMLALLSQVVDDVFECDEDEIAMSVLRLMEQAKVVAEGSGAIVLGALDRYRDEIRGKKIVLFVSGGNIDVNLLSRIIDRGLMRSGRKVHLRVQISDRPGSLAKLTALIGDLNANILQATHDRSEMSIKFDETEVELMLETRGVHHSSEVIESLKKHCLRVVTL